MKSLPHSIYPGANGRIEKLVTPAGAPPLHPVKLISCEE